MQLLIAIDGHAVAQGSAVAVEWFMASMAPKKARAANRRNEARINARC